MKLNPFSFLFGGAPAAVVSPDPATALASVPPGAGASGVPGSAAAAASGAFAASEFEKILAAAYLARDTANASAAAARAELMATQDVQKAQAEELTTLKGQLAALTEEKATLISERDTFKAAAEKTTEEIRGAVRNEELATLAASQGVPPGQVPGVQAGGSEGDTAESLQAEIAACTDPKKYRALCARVRVLLDPKAKAKAAAAAA